MDTTIPHGELLFHLFGSLAQYECSLAREHILAGLESARKRGRRGGRPRIIDEEKEAVIRQMLSQGASKASICRAFKLPRSTLYDMINRE